MQKAKRTTIRLLCDVRSRVRCCLEHCQLLISHTTTCEHIETNIYFISIFFLFLSFARNVLHCFQCLVIVVCCRITWTSLNRMVHNYCGFVFCYVSCLFHNWECMQLKLISVFIQSVNRTVDERDTRQCEKVLTIIIYLFFFFKKKFFSFEFRSQ